MENYGQMNEEKCIGNETEISRMIPTESTEPSTSSGDSYMEHRTPSYSTTTILNAFNTATEVTNIPTEPNMSESTSDIIHTSSDTTKIMTENGNTNEFEKNDVQQLENSQIWTNGFRTWAKGIRIWANDFKEMKKQSSKIKTYGTVNSLENAPSNVNIFNIVINMRT